MSTFDQKSGNRATTLVGEALPDEVDSPYRVLFNPYHQKYAVCEAQEAAKLVGQEEINFDLFKFSEFSEAQQEAKARQLLVDLGISDLLSKYEYRRSTDGYKSGAEGIQYSEEDIQNLFEKLPELLKPFLNNEPIFRLWEARDGALPEAARKFEQRDQLLPSFCPSSVRQVIELIASIDNDGCEWCDSAAAAEANSAV